MSVLEKVDLDIIQIPLLPLRDVVVYPHMVIPLFVGRDKSIKALELGLSENKNILLVTQKDAAIDNPEQDDLYHVGTISSILQLLKLPDGTVKVLVEGLQRGVIVNYLQNDPYLLVQVEALKFEELQQKELEAVFRSTVSQFEQYVKLNKKISPEILTSLSTLTDPSRLIDTIAAHMTIKVFEKQKILNIANLQERVTQLMNILESEIELLQIEKKIRNQVTRQIDKNQREYYLHEQMKVIQKELGELGDGVGEINGILKKIEKAKMPKEARNKINLELNKLKLMPAMSAEATVCRNYIDWMLQVPWTKKTSSLIELNQAENILNQDHYGLEKVKERIIEYLAVLKRVKKLNGPILCLVGPPGVGKTSLGESIARATQRQFVRMALGGVHDEAEIRGHRRTYIGAMPGKIIQKLAKVSVNNPLFLLDEIDKISTDFRGDPASALLEVLDPEQNSAFNDHYLEVDYDLSNVMFIATANSLNIPAALLDRMEVIFLSGYTEDEKLNIATRYLIPKQLKKNGLKDFELNIEQDAVLEIIRYYTREAGVRGLEREISKICRKIVKEITLNSAAVPYQISASDLEKVLGIKRYRFGQAEKHDQIGQVTGLAWTESGGDILTIESMVVPGKGKVVTTGHLGNVMQESIQAAITVVRNRAQSLGIATDFAEKCDIHIHIPEGATPKEGPSAGIGICTALVSMLTGITVRKDFAMTGEITLRGQVLPIGGLKEKLLAARRAGISNVIIPEENLRDLREIPEHIYSSIKIWSVHWIDEVFKLALTRAPQELSENLSLENNVKAKGSIDSTITH